MLPNWLYGKSKSKLADILGGGGGAPSDYNQVKAQVTQNTEDIASLDDALDTKAALTQITNPNLLDNPWFTVNQRGQSSYTEAEAYTVDRWKLKRTAAAGTLSVTDDGVIISASDATNKTVFITQYFEEDFLKSLNGKTITASVLKPDGTILKGTIASFDYQTSVQLFNKNGFVLSYEVYNNAYNLRIQNWTQSDITIRAVKLELGEVSTLAMDTAPNYATELLKCQRYFIRAKANSAEGALILGMGYALSATMLRAGITLPTKMRTTPTMVISNNSYFKWIGCGQTQSPDTVDILFSDDMQHITLRESNATGFTANEVVALRGDVGGYIDFSADL